MEPGTVKWPEVLAGAAWFHMTGITPALGERAAACTAEAMEAAKKAGLRVSVDLNFRKKLWSEAAAQKTMRPLMRFVGDFNRVSVAEVDALAKGDASGRVQR